MIPTILIGAALSLSVGGLVKLALDKSGSDRRITRTEYVIGAVICSVVLIPATAAIGEHLAVNAQLSYNEFWNGWETAVDAPVRQCTRDGSCAHHYACDPYTVTETYTTTDSKGRSTLHTRTVTKWHECPVGTEEADYIIKTTLGDAVVAAGHYTPNTRPWRGRALNDDTNPPASWVAAKARLDAGQPGGVAQVHSYDNFLLASGDALLSKFSGAIGTYKAAGVLPAPVAGTSSALRADKAYFVGTAPADPQVWQDASARVNAALGTLHQGDLHVVLVNTDKVTDPDEYTNALLTYWQSPDLGDNAASKNTVVVVVGTTDGRTVAWARAGTGMPVGNEALITKIRTGLNGVAWTPDALLGTVSATVRAGDVADADITIGDGALTKALFATDGTGYSRVKMTSDGSVVGYEYLKSQVHPTAGQYVLITAIAFALSLAVWAVLVATQMGQAPLPARYRSPSYRQSTYRFPKDRSRW